MGLNLRQIEVFRTIMLTHSISGAAKLLNVSQPAVSRLMSHTEQRLGFKLFERIKGRLYPTPEAKRLFVEVNLVYSGVQRVNELAEDLIEQRSALLRIAASANLSQSLLPMAVAAFLKKFPDVRIMLHTMSPQDMLPSLFSQQVEIGIAYLALSHPNLNMQTLFDNAIVAVLPEGHALSRSKQLHIDQLVDEPLIGYSPDIPFGQVVRRIFDAASRPPKPRVEVQQAHVAAALAQQGIGIALVDAQTVRAQHLPGVVVIPIVPTVATPVQLFYPLHEPLSRPAQNFVKTLKAIAAKIR